MLRPCLLLIGLRLAGAAMAKTDIRPVASWDDYREALMADGSSPADADDTIAAMLGDLKNMDRPACADEIVSPAPPFRFDAWLNSPPLSLQDLRGEVVLVRWWTDTCPFCASSSPALRALDREYADKGLRVVGVFHPKAGRDDPRDVARVERAVETRRFVFPVAIDWDWRNGTLKDWWLTGPKRPATSVTFILDKTGTIRFIHPGMEYHDATSAGGHPWCVDDMGRIRDVIERLLAE